MKAIKYIFSLTILLAVVYGCSKKLNDDTSFVDQATLAGGLSALFEIAQDNSGMVTITPNGEGAVSYDVYFGDATTAPATVQAGKNVQHKYAEGVYNVKLVAYNITGKTAEATQQLTVSFKAPENLSFTITADAANRLKVKVVAKADFETYFKVYFGETPSEIPMSVNEGDTASHVYSKVGTYNIKVVALGGGSATVQLIKQYVISSQLVLPVTFDEPGIDYTVTDFGQALTITLNDPKAPSNKVKRTTKKVGAETWAGTTIGTASGFATAIPISASATQMSIRVYSPAAGIPVRLKIEDHADPTKSVETETLTTKALTWETLIFDFKNNAAGTAAINSSYTYDKASVFFDFGKVGNGKNYLWDDVKFLPVNIVTGINLPLDFESSTLTYSFTDFDGGGTTVVNNSKSGGINTSAKVGKMIKSAGQPWGGSWIALNSPIDFSTNKTFKMKVYSPRVGAKVLLKTENATDGAISYEKEVTTTLANTWEDLSFDFSAINTANSYQKIVLIFELGTMGDGSANFTFLFDDIRLVAGSSTGGGISLPLDFQSTTATYTFTNFDGGDVSVLNNPSSGGINTSSKVAKMVKNSGQPWGGSFISLDAPIDFSVKKTFKMKVYSPRVGAKVLLKVENLTDGTVSYEKEVQTTTANQWEELTFDYSAINAAKSYQKVVLIFDLGTVGDGSANFTWLFDDISLN